MSDHDHHNYGDRHGVHVAHQGTDFGDAVEANHRLQHRYPSDARFCALCGGAMRTRIVLPDSKHRKVCESCGFVHFSGPKLVAGCVVIDAGRVMLLRRGNDPQIGAWTFPGGYVDLGEVPVQAALRETLEEVGMHVTPDGLLGFYADVQNPTAVVIAYLATPGSEAPRVSREAIEIKYIGPQEIPWDEVSFRTTHGALRDWIELDQKRHA